MLLVVFLAAGCGPWLFENPTPTRERVETFIGAPIPPSAQDIHLAEGGFTDAIIWLRFDAPPADVEGFLAAAGADEPLDPAWEIARLTPLADEDWWQPESAAQGAGVTFDSPERNRYCRAYADQTRADLWRLYVVCHST